LEKVNEPKITMTSLVREKNPTRERRGVHLRYGNVYGDPRKIRKQIYCQKGKARWGKRGGDGEGHSRPMLPLIKKQGYEFGEKKSVGESEHSFRNVRMDQRLELLVKKGEKKGNRA